MPTRSPHPSLKIPEKNLLSYLFLADDATAICDKPIWIDASNPSVYLTQKTLLSTAKRLAVGIEKRSCADGNLLAKPGEVVLIFSPNQIMIPAAYLGSVGSQRIFSGINAGLSVRGRFPSKPINFK
jgi:4-coumarate--CoA ligase